MNKVLGCLLLWVLFRDSAVLPELVGEDLSGKTVDFEWMGERPTIAIFTFSRAAAADARAWRTRIDQDFHSEVKTREISIILLEAVPKILRAMVKSSIKSSMPHELYSSTLLVFQEEDRWKKLLDVSDDRHAYVLFVRKDGHLSSTAASGFSEEEYKRAKTMLSRPVP